MSNKGSSVFLLIFHCKNPDVLYVFQSFTHMHTHNVYELGLEVNVTSWAAASEWLQLCLNPSVM